MKLVFVLTFVVVLLGVEGVPLEDKPQTFCGRHLANARMLYCFGMIDYTRKRSSFRTSSLLALLLPKESSLAASERANQFFKHGNRGLTMPSKRVGIVDECCLKPCYISELLNYC